MSLDFTYHSIGCIKDRCNSVKTIVVIVHNGLDFVSAPIYITASLNAVWARFFNDNI